MHQVGFVRQRHQLQFQFGGSAQRPVAYAALWLLLPFRLGRLPGDIYIRRDNLSFYFPITTAIVISVVLSILVALLRR